MFVTFSEESNIKFLVEFIWSVWSARIRFYHRIKKRTGKSSLLFPNHNTPLLSHEIQKNADS